MDNPNRPPFAPRGRGSPRQVNPRGFDHNFQRGPRPIGAQPPIRERPPRPPMFERPPLDARPLDQPGLGHNPRLPPSNMAGPQREQVQPRPPVAKRGPSPMVTGSSLGITRPANKQQLIKTLQEQRVIFSSPLVLERNKARTIYVFYFSNATINGDGFEQSYELFTDLIRKRSDEVWNTKFLIEDCDKSGEQLTKSRVSMFKNGKVEVYDCNKTENDDSLVGCLIQGNYQKVTRDQRKSTALVIKCPKASCVEHGKNVWKCRFCSEIVFYGFDERFYCKCGGQHFSRFSFQCHHETHGPQNEKLSSTVSF